MKTTNDLLDSAKKAQGVESDYRLAQLLGVSKNAITNYRYGKSCPEDEVAIRLSGMVGRDPASVIAEMHAERAKSPEVRAIWLRMAKQLRETAAANVLSAVGIAMLLVAGMPAPVRASEHSPTHGSGSGSVYYVK